MRINFSIARRAISRHPLASLPMEYRYLALPLATLGFVVSTGAQAVPPSSDQPVALSEFVVTGSNIRRVDAETALPVTIVNRDEIDARGGATMSELFETITMAE